MHAAADFNVARCKVRRLTFCVAACDGKGLFPGERGALQQGASKRGAWQWGAPKRGALTAAAAAVIPSVAAASKPQVP